MLPTLLSIALLHWLVLITPGANVLLVSQLAASSHRNSAFYAGLGISFVAVTWALLAILGVNALFAAHPIVRLALQIAGAVYLCFVAVRLWRSGASASESRVVHLHAWAAFRLGFITNLLNPKSALFFGSVFATALPAENSPDLLAASIALVFANALAWHTFLALAFSRPKVQSAYSRKRELLNRLASAVVGVFGLRLLAAAVVEIRSPHA
jgi:threonine efflux protein